MISLESVQAYLTGPWLLMALFAMGLVVGVLSGLFGVGGGFLVVPLLHTLLGIPMTPAVGSDLAFIVGTSGAGVARHWRLGNIEKNAVVCLSLGSVPGAILGTILHNSLGQMLKQSGLTSFDTFMKILFIVLLPLTAWLVWKGPAKGEAAKAPLQRIRLGPYVSLPDSDIPQISLPGLIAVGMSVGLLTGLLGVGGGVLFMPLLLLIVGLSAHKAVGTSLGVVLMASIAGTIKHGLAGNVCLPIALALLTGSASGVQIGAWICQHLKGLHLRRYFAILVLLVCAVLVIDLTVKACQ